MKEEDDDSGGGDDDSGDDGVVPLPPPADGGAPPSLPPPSLLQYAPSTSSMTGASTIGIVPGGLQQEMSLLESDARKRADGLRQMFSRFAGGLQRESLTLLDIQNRLTDAGLDLEHMNVMKDLQSILGTGELNFEKLLSCWRVGGLPHSLFPPLIHRFYEIASRAGQTDTQASLLLRALKGTLAIPDFKDFCASVQAMYNELESPDPDSPFAISI